MSRRVVIKGGVHCRLSNLAEEVVREMLSEGTAGLRYDAKEGSFLYEGYDDHYKHGLVEKAEICYGRKLQEHHVAKIEENAKKQGFIVEKATSQSGKVKIKLTRRSYG